MGANPRPSTVDTVRYAVLGVHVACLSIEITIQLKYEEVMNWFPKRPNKLVSVLVSTVPACNSDDDHLIAGSCTNS